VYSGSDSGERSESDAAVAAGVALQRSIRRRRGAAQLDWRSSSLASGAWRRLELSKKKKNTCIGKMG
jgi:hypothetical protein